MKPVSRTRVIASQVVACLALDLLLIDLGMSFTFVTIVLPEVLKAKEGLSITETQASWFGSMAFLCQPLGSIFSGPILDYFGRRRALLIVNIPHIIAWLLMHFAWSVPSLFAANAMLGIGTGFMEAPSVTYVGEVSDASVRGILTTVSNSFTSTGMLVVFFLGKMLPWRQAALVCLAVPLISMLFVILVPETPIWLLAKGRPAEALESLRRLRGWAPAENVKEEFDKLVQYNEDIHRCVLCVRTGAERKPCEHYNNGVFRKAALKFRHVMLSQETVRPFILVMAYFVFHAMSGLAAIRPNMINVCKALGMAYDPKTLVIFVGVIYILMSLVSAVTVKLVGKRKLVVGSMLATSCSSLAISVYSWRSVARGVFSYEPSTFPAETSAVPVVLFMLLVCFTSLGIPWVLLSEMFPFRSRGIATGLAAASTYVVFFIATKTNYNLEQALHISGAFATYASFGIVGTIYLYLFLPETENVSLEDIERFYKGEYRIFADDAFINFFIRKKKIRTEQNQPMLVN